MGEITAQVGSDTREKQQSTGLVATNDTTFPCPQPPSTELVGEYKWDKKTQGGKQSEEESVKQAKVTLCTAKICKLPQLYIALNHPPCNDQNVKKQMSLGKQKKKQSTKATPCVLSL